MVALKPGERLINLGSGDGRIPRATAWPGATALGVEIDSALVARARMLTRLEGLHPHLALPQTGKPIAAWSVTAPPPAKGGAQRID